MDFYNGILENRHALIQETFQAVKHYLAHPEEAMPEPLAMALRCERFHCLLVAGGYYDQPDFDMMLIEAAIAARTEYEQEIRERELAAQIAQRSLAFLKEHQHGFAAPTSDE